MWVKRGRHKKWFTGTPDFLRISAGTNGQEKRPKPLFFTRAGEIIPAKSKR